MAKTMRIASRFLLALLLAAASGYSARAQTGYGDGANAPESKMRADEEFVKDAASGGMAEVKLGQLAQEKGSNSAVKAFGERIVNDHSKAGDDLRAAAAQSSISIPDKMSAKDEATYNRLAKMSGAAFDREYARVMVTDHIHHVAEFRKEALDGRNQAVQNFASQTLPALQQHLKEARTMEKAVSARESASSEANDAY
jgi:putative membrane protein